MRAGEHHLATGLWEGERLGVLAECAQLETPSALALGCRGRGRKKVVAECARKINQVVDCGRYSLNARSREKTSLISWFGGGEGSVLVACAQ